MYTLLFNQNQYKDDVGLLLSTGLYREVLWSKKPVN